MNRLKAIGGAIGVSLSLLTTGCGPSTADIQAIPSTYTLTVSSGNPAIGVSITAAPADNNGVGSGSTSFTLTYYAGTTVTLAASATAGGNGLSSWSGCTTSSGASCTVTVHANTTVTATYSLPTVTSVVVTPNAPSVSIGATQQFTAAVAGTGGYNNAVTWSVSGPTGSTLSPGTISATGLYTTPYPAPSSAIITATSVASPAISGSATVSLTVPSAGTGPTLTVDAGNQTHAISPFIYGSNAFQLTNSVITAANIPVVRFGGDGTSRYNYLLDATNSGGDNYFINHVGTTGVEATGQFNSLVTSNQTLGAKTMGTVNVLGWIAKDASSCSFPMTVYPNQYAFNYANCGDGETQAQTNITGVSPTATSLAASTSFTGTWVSYLVNRFGTAANGGVAIYSLDNEPSQWDNTHRDVHPLPFTYDEVTNNGISTALAVKTADPTAAVTGPVIDTWSEYFYSAEDKENGYLTAPCYHFWSDPADRKAHGGIPFIEYYLQQFAAYQTKNNVRLLDYVDIHAYYAGVYNGVPLAYSLSGDTGAQQVRLDSTRVFWDPTYTDARYLQPNYTTDANYTSSCNPPAQAPVLIPLLKGWVTKDYPGTKTAITEYNWGGLEAVSGALAQADILGIFGSYGLDLGTMWSPPQPVTQVPGIMAFQIYRNYDGNNSMFGNQALASTSASQGALSVYGALRTADNMVTIVVINKTYGDLTSTISLVNFTPSGTGKAFLYSNANPAAITSQAAVAVTPPAVGSTTSTLSATFPAQSITLFVVPKK